MSSRVSPLPGQPPLRTVRASFPAYGSSSITLEIRMYLLMAEHVQKLHIENVVLSSLRERCRVVDVKLLAIVQLATALRA